MKILILSSEYPPIKIYGLGRAVHDLACAIASKDHEVHVLTNSIGGVNEDVTDDGVNVHRIYFPNPPMPPDGVSAVVQFNVCLVEKALKRLADENFDIIHSHNWLTAMAASELKRILALPLVTTIHDTVMGRNKGSLNRRDYYMASIEKWICDHSDGVICCSDFIRNELETAYKLPRSKIFVTPCGIDPHAFSAECRRDVFRQAIADDAEKVITYVGRLDQEKGVEVLIEAASKVMAVAPKTKLVIAGTGKLQKHLENVAAKAGIRENVNFTGYLSCDVLTNLYKSSDVVVYPSLYEPFGIVALEGMACGAPVIASNTGGLAEIVEDGVNGMTFEAGNSQELASKIIEVLSDLALAKHLTEKGTETVMTKYSWQTIADETINVFTQCVKGEAGVTAQTE